MDDTAGRQHRLALGDGQDRRQQRHDADRAAIEVPTTFTALGNDDVRALGDGDAGQLHRPRLHHHQQPGVFRPGNHVGGIFLGIEQRQQSGLLLEDHLELRFEHIRPAELRHQVHPEGLVGQCPCFLDPATQGQRWQAQAAEHAHAPGVGHGPDQLRAGNGGHAAEEDRVVHAAEPGDDITRKNGFVLFHDSQLHMFAKHPLERVVLQEKVIFRGTENMQREPCEERGGANGEQHIDHMLQGGVNRQERRNP
ncbi:hypothetical protein D3C76_958410 [compost metagenome]